MDEVNTHQQLRPYYDPDTFNAGYSSVFKPDQGVIDNHGFSIASKLNIVSQSKSKVTKKLRESGMLSQLTTGLKSPSRNPESSAEEAHKSLADMEWSDLLNWRSWRAIGTQLLEQFLKRYFRHLIQQPFEVARFLLQVGEFNPIKVDDRSKITLEVEEEKEDGSVEDDEEEIEYFPRADIGSQEEETQAPVNHQQHAQHSAPTLTKKIQPESLHTMDILNSVMDEEGTRGLWRANNTTFIYNFLSVTLDAWFTGLLSPVFQVPDPFFIDIVHSTDTRKSVILTVSASVFTGLVLLPVDIIRTRLTITSVKVGDRSLRNLLRNWSWRQHAFSLPLDLVLLKIGDSVATTLFSKLTSVMLYHLFNIDRYSQTMWYNTLEFMSKMLELFVKLPIENLSRRAQTWYLLRAKARDPFPVHEDNLIITPRKYKGVWATLQERDRTHELWRGWRLGLLSMLCGYGLKMMNLEALEEEKF
ncbi:LAQU0S11e03774g1_1 [Lachancea quebecensis]|uniref:LAQU0S11e03774g1_1 n=1 Tax=Lachancea quebecensis TaxID=1654605 RepID=A0A0P1KVF8_9SACH|nr:LAQU0S11e03774g1_1 [Lachancea quebecensis]